MGNSPCPQRAHSLGAGLAREHVFLSWGVVCQVLQGVGCSRVGLHVRQ